MNKNDKGAELLFRMLRWAYLKDHRIPPTEEFTDRAANEIRATPPSPVDNLEELIRWAYRDGDAGKAESDAEEERFVEAAWQRIGKEGSNLPSQQDTFAGWFEHYARQSLRVATPFAAALACWLMVVGVTPHIELRKLLESGF